MNLAKFAIDKKVISSLSTILILFLGYWSYTMLPRFEDPEFIIREAQVITPYPGASAQEVSDEVTDRIESAVQLLQGVKEVRSVSSIGRSEVTVEFEISAAKNRSALHQKFTQLRAKIQDAQSGLPPRAGPSVVNDDYGDVFALYYALTGDGYSLTEVLDYAKDLQKQLVLVPGVSKVVLTGAPEEVIYVEYSISRIKQLGLSTDSIAKVLSGQNLVTPSGTVDSGSMQLLIRPSSEINSLEAIGNLFIVNPSTGSSYRLRDIAEIKRGLKEPAEHLIFRNGKPAIGLGISNTIGGNVVNMGEAVKKRLKELENQRPLGIELTAVSDQSTSVKQSVNDFVMNVALALVIVVGTLLVFMGIRSGILMGGILLITVAATLFGMYVFGLDMQRISLGALIIALGMLVDNAIVVVEGTMVRMQEGDSPAEASVDIVKKTILPLLGGTVVGFLAFSPIGFSPDKTGEYAGSLFWTITISLMFSWLIAVWLTPFYCKLVLTSDKQDKAPEEEKEPAILTYYREWLRAAIKNRYLTVIVIGLLFASALICFSFVKKGFFPSSTRTQFVIDYFLPEGTGIQRTEKDIKEISKWVRTLKGVTGTNSTVGASHLRFMLIYSIESPNTAYGQVLVDVSSADQISPLLTKIQNHISNNYPDSTPKAWKFILGPGGGSLIEARFTGPEPSVLRELSNKAKAIMADAGAVGVKDDWREKIQVVQPAINVEKMRRAGLSKADISNAIATVFDGARIGIYRERDELRKIIMRPIQSDRQAIDQIKEVQIYSPVYKKYIPILQVVDNFNIVFQNSRMMRFNRALAIMAKSDPAPGRITSELFEKVRPAIEAIPLPPGYNLEWKGEFGNSKQAQAGLASTMPFGFGAMIVVVLLLFDAVRQPLIIWLTVPLALIGVVYGLIIMDTPLDFIAMLAILSLTGMLIKNAIVLIDETDSLISKGTARMTAVIEAAVSRARPVGLGVLTTVLGVVPLLWDPFFKSLAVIIIYGLSFATILTLIIVPTFYAIFFKIKDNEVKEH